MTLLVYLKLIGEYGRILNIKRAELISGSALLHNQLSFFCPVCLIGML